MTFRMRHTIAALRDDESGLGLIEVLVSALLLVLVASGVYLGLDGASATSGANKHRTQASQIAQQDQDRMRAMTVGELSNYRETWSPPPVGGITYTVASSASWVTDSTGSASCTTGQAKASYLRISSVVTWPNMPIDPVAIESLIAPPAGSFNTNLGSLGVQVSNGQGEGVPGVSVALTGPKAYTDVTNANGCVLWGYLPVGDYRVTISRGGYMDTAGVATPSQAVTVVGEATTTLSFAYDVGGSIRVAYQTLRGYNGAALTLPASTYMLENSHFSTPIGPSAGDGTGVLRFPYNDAYGVYAGACAGADPQDSSQAAQLALVRPGATTNVAVRLPPIDIRVVNGTTGINGATVVLTGTSSGCGLQSTRTTNSTSPGTGYLSDFDRAYPYGRYNVCVYGLIGTTRWKLTGTVNNSSPLGVPVASATYNLASRSAIRDGTCP